MWTLLEIHEVQFIVQLRSRLWSRNISGPIISSVELLGDIQGESGWTYALAVAGGLGVYATG